MYAHMHRQVERIHADSFSLSMNEHVPKSLPLSFSHSPQPSVCVPCFAAPTHCCSTTGQDKLNHTHIYYRPAAPQPDIRPPVSALVKRQESDTSHTHT